MNGAFFIFCYLMAIALEAQWRNPADMMGCKFLSSLFPDVLPEEGFLARNPDAVKKAKEFGRLLAMA